ncbi:MAG TPA: suppressor of fused domain protein, partial [Mycolicibacterium fallax]|nr:suppressor of fused domain protein [Mycolicibacterium fallax]
MSAVVDRVREQLRAHFAAAGNLAEPASASVTFLGLEPIQVLRFGPDSAGVLSYVSVGCARHPMADPTDIAADPHRGPRAEVVVTLRAGLPTAGLARSVALLAATPAVEGVVLTPDALIDLGAPLWEPTTAGVFSAFL